jgi:hemerythrin-like domain-containing protein
MTCIQSINLKPEFMLPTENLMQEHKKIIEILDIINKIAENIKHKKVFYPLDVEEITNFLTSFWDKCHNVKEEKALYPELISSGVQIEDKSIDGISNEHTMGRIYIKEMKYCIVNCKMGHDFSCEKLADCLVNYSTLLRNHIQIEEEVIFPIINQTLTGKKQQEILRSFVEIEEETLGLQVPEKYSELISYLKAKYTDIIFQNLEQVMTAQLQFIYG